MKLSPVGAQEDVSGKPATGADVVRKGPGDFVIGVLKTVRGERREAYEEAAEFVADNSVGPGDQGIGCRAAWDSLGEGSLGKGHAVRKGEECPVRGGERVRVRLEGRTDDGREGVDSDRENVVPVISEFRFVGSQRSVRLPDLRDRGELASETGREV